jgi:hypothetical protein
MMGMGTKHIDPLLCLYLGAYLMFIDNKHLKDIVPTVHLTSTVHPVPGNQEFGLALGETIVELVKKTRSLTWGKV